MFSSTFTFTYVHIYIRGITGTFSWDWETETFNNLSVGSITRYKTIPLANGLYKFEFS